MFKSNRNKEKYLITQRKSIYPLNPKKELMPLITNCTPIDNAMKPIIRVITIIPLLPITVFNHGATRIMPHATNAHNNTAIVLMM